MVTCIVLFGGRGNRFKHSEPKQYFEILGKSLLVYCLESLRTIKHLTQLVIVCEPTERKRVQKMITKMTPVHKQPEIVNCPPIEDNRNCLLLSKIGQGDMLLKEEALQ